MFLKLTDKGGATAFFNMDRVRLFTRDSEHRYTNLVHCDHLEDAWTCVVETPNEIMDLMGSGR